MEGDIVKDPEKIKLLDHIYKFDSLYRGKYLIMSNWVEDTIGGLISEHFIPKDKNKRDLLYSLILINIPFNSKIRIFLQILERSYPSLNDKHSSLKQDLERIRNLRNRFAHSVLDTSDEFLEKKQYDRINLEFHKDGERKFHEITQKYIDGEISFVGRVIESSLLAISIEMKKILGISLDEKR
ncbi:MAG TPA: hypothetical protein VFA69_04885 [Candidatus Nitrosotalea sp.]|nr:hypothetical protein [Candidatus Nitrosotalea sp.]